VNTLRSQNTTVETVITSIATVGNRHILAGFSNGAVVLWSCDDANKYVWTEQVLQAPGTFASVTDLDGMVLESGELLVVACTSKGVHAVSPLQKHDILGGHVTAANTARLIELSSGGPILLLVGTAAPRHNKIHVYSWNSDGFVHTGSLTGHEDWITDLAWDARKGANSAMLASASQDARIRLWEFKMTFSSEDVTEKGEETAVPISEEREDHEDDSSEEDSLQEEDDDGEARLELKHRGGITRVFLEALLYGHEEAVTSVAWHPHPDELYRQDRVLISSSMDRTLLIWCCTDLVWTPLTRVGAAGGILGGSLGSTLLGFVGLAVEPVSGTTLVGHAYGGALHIWTLQEEHQQDMSSVLSTEGLALRNKWKATPCITGHFGGVTDCCWEASAGEYLLTVSNDQTCRLWGQLDGDNLWVELARPQVHGYDLSTITSVSTPEFKHRIVTGADEKEIRVFDAPLTTIKVLKATGNTSSTDGSDAFSRAERAYIPSLGLSNKASAADGAEEDTEGVSSASNSQKGFSLPLERDLGAVSLWPETSKLYGHNTELYRLTSTVAAAPLDSVGSNEVLVASSAKARDAEDASIRIWNVATGKCLQVLSGGHKSTVAALTFSSDGHYLASSGKDRRLCIWSRTSGGSHLFEIWKAVESAHKRIVWALHFCPLEPKILASGSRDGTVKIWRVDKEDCERPIHTFEPTTQPGKKPEAVTAVSFAPRTISSYWPLALGLENGLIELWGIGNNDYKLLEVFSPSVCHAATVTKLCWRPSEKDGNLILASTSMDRGCRLFRVSIV
jgi:WD40 repeat protein